MRPTQNGQQLPQHCEPVPPMRIGAGQLHCTGGLMERTRPQYATKAAITRAVDAVRACGIMPGSVELGPDGTIRILQPDAKPADAYTAWEHKL